MKKMKIDRLVLFLKLFFIYFAIAFSVKCLFFLGSFLLKPGHYFDVQSFFNMTTQLAFALTLAFITTKRYENDSIELSGSYQSIAIKNILLKDKWRLEKENEKALVFKPNFFSSLLPLRITALINDDTLILQGPRFYVQNVVERLNK